MSAYWFAQTPSNNCSLAAPAFSRHHAYAHTRNPLSVHGGGLYTRRTRHRTNTTTTTTTHPQTRSHTPAPIRSRPTDHVHTTHIGDPPHARNRLTECRAAKSIHASVRTRATGLRLWCCAGAVVSACSACWRSNWRIAFSLP